MFGESGAGKTHSLFGDMNGLVFKSIEFLFLNINQISLKMIEISLTKKLIYHVERLLKTTLIVKYLEEHKDKEALEKEVNKIYIKIYFIMKKSFL